jgi:DNA/RNA-binding domain of Phe-tRNA-synthetase-like protein
MKELFYSVSKDVFSLFPGYSRGVVLAYDVTNRESSNELISLLRNAEASVRERMNIDNVAEYPQIKAWRDAYRLFGAKPSEFRSSTEAMSRRALRNDQMPSINALVDIGNVISLRHIVNVGGHAIDDIDEDLALRRATGVEKFIPFGSDQVESPLPGEIIFTEGDTVLTRRWTWRQANHTLTLITTKSIEFNVDGLPPVAVSEVEAICNEVAEMIKRFCGGRIRYEILTQNNPQIRLSE